MIITRNVALYTRLSEDLRNYVLDEINARVVANGAAPFTDPASFALTGIASTLLDESKAFKQALAWTRAALERSASVYKGDTRTYAEGYIAHLLDGGVIPQALTITLTQAINIRMKLDTAITKVKIVREKKKPRKAKGKK